MVEVNNPSYLGHGQDADQSMISQGSQRSVSSQAQKNQELKKIVNKIFQKNGLPKISNLSKDFADGSK